MNTEQSYRLLRIAFSLLKQKASRQHKDELDIAFSCGRDLYDFVEQHTTDATLIYQMSECRKAEHLDSRLKCLRYLNHRLNIGFT